MDRDSIYNELLLLIEKLRDNKWIFTINDLIDDKEYSTSTYYYWMAAYQRDKEINDLIQKIEDILENRLIKWAMSWVLNNRMVSEIIAKKDRNKNRMKHLRTFFK